ncbi:TonB-dependent receptor [Edaphobacter modestus]|uniref:Carboxypeptidase family protein n=1 Tax=Edaphobacter modestus TaxID=388466 RepID=A0A4Q7YW96_9BACT|nr:TonB-dependent receptor [Edaphobacter modestus]RZU42182.1 carboxypeptidase family protein [Edaphobacter modestus]
MRFLVQAARRLAISVSAFLMLLIVPCVLRAQVDTGSIVGQVTDLTGATVPGATVTIAEENTGIRNMVQAGNDGSFTFSPVKLGVYTVTAEKPGFKKSVQSHVTVSIQSRLELGFKLEVGSVAESVQVESTVALLETQTSSVQQLVDARAINALPLNGRNPAFLAQLSPGVTFAQNDGRNLQASGSFTANGAKRTQNNYLLDGMDNNAAIGDLVNQAQYVVMPPPDALREFTVQTSNYSAEFGHSAGAVLNVSTKSGSNRFHGNLWEYVRNDLFDAKDYFVLANQQKPKFRLNQFGGTLGGPVIIPHLYNGHDKTFFFVDYQGSRIVQGKTYTRTVPTAAEAASNFTNLQDLITLQTGSRTDALGRSFPTGTVFDPATTRAIPASGIDPVTGLAGTAGGYVRDPFYNGSVAGKSVYTDAASIAQMNQIPASRMYPGAVNLLKLYPAPTSGGLINNYTSSPNNVTNINSFDARIDQQIGQKDSVFFRYSFMYNDQVTPGPFPGIADGGASRPGNGYTESQNGALGWTHILTSHLVNEARVGYSRVFDKRLQPQANTLGIPEQYGIPGIPQIAQNGGLPLFEFGGANGLSNLGAAGTLPSDKASNVLQVTENVSFDRSHHQIRTGFEFQNVAFPMATPTASRGDFVHSGIYTSVVNNTDGSTDRAQFLLNPIASTVPGGVNYLGGANTLTATNFPPAFYPIRNYYAAYGQDSWRVTPTLTLNLGLRYEFLGIPAERDGRVGNFVAAATGDTPDGLSRYYFPQRRLSELGTTFTSFLAANNILLTPTADSAIGLAQKTNFAPRIGFAFQPAQKVSVRGGYGLFYQANENHGLSISPYINFPFQVTTSFTGGSAVAGIVNPATGQADGSIGPISQGFDNISLSPSSVVPGSLAFNGEPRFPKTGYTQAYSLQVQYQVAPNTIVFAGYIGGNSRHIQTSLPTNTTNLIRPATTTLRTISFFPNFATGGTYLSRNGASNYNSLQFGAERRFSNGLAFTANMTYSKCMSNVRDLLDNGVGNVRAPYVQGMGLGADNTLCDIDVRRIVHTSGTYELPFGKGRRFLTSGAAAWVAGGWSTNWILTVQDGQPFSVACTTTTAAGLGCFALKVPGQDLYAGPHNVTQFLNPAAFANPPAATANSATIANLGGPGGQVSGPPFRRLDFSVFRRFNAFRESYFEFRGEVFNVTNTANFAQPGSLNFTTPSTFARISATRDNPNDPRQIQLSGKYYF